MRTSTTVSPVRPEDLPQLALSRPDVALERAREVLSSTADHVALSLAHQAAGIVHREDGAMPEAVSELRAGLRAAKASGSPERVADVQATLGATLVMDGRTRPGIAQLDAAAQAASGLLLGTVLMRRAFIFSQLGRHSEALSDMRRALKGIRRAGDSVWEARALTSRGLIHLARGALSRAEHDILRAEALFQAAGQELEAVDNLEHRGLIAFCRGDLPRTLSLYDEAARRYAPISSPPPELVIDRCAALLAAGLANDALEVVEQALTQSAIQPRSRAELLLAAANAALSAKDPAKALETGREARRLFRRQGREWWAARADLAIVRARRDAGERGRSLLVASAALGQRMQELRADDAPHALLLAGRFAAEQGAESAHALLTAAARYQRNPSALVRAVGWLAQAVDREASGDSRGVFAACSRGLDALDEHRTTLGSSELRALATGHGEELANLALRSAVASGDARRLLTWSERWRGTALTQPPVRPPRDARLATQLGNIRSQSRELGEVRSRGADNAALEQLIRSQRHRLSGVPERPHRLDVHHFVEELDGEVFVELLMVDAFLYAVTVSGSRVRSHRVGKVSDALAAVAAARFVLRQAARGRPTTLSGIGERLEAVLLGPALEGLGSGRVVVAPPSRLHATPWALIPALSDRPVSVVPSAAMWRRARDARRPSESRTVLIAGPGLRTGGAEVDALARRDPGAVLLRDGAAKVPACLAAIDGASLAHIAAHGHFRPDSPMFSSLLVDDGPLTVHDFELLHRAPYRLVLSACDSGVMAPVGANELLGVTSALLSLGTAGIVSSIAEVNDEATVELMLDLHHGLSSGMGLPDVLLLARERAHGELVREATAAAFVAFGV
jgi:tetratricopeptide (TPR) repeat protein